MPSKSKKQAKFMAACSSEEGRKSMKSCPSSDVAEEFHMHDKKKGNFFGKKDNQPPPKKKKGKRGGAKLQKEALEGKY
jgi:hypothetical protein